MLDRLAAWAALSVALAMSGAFAWHMSVCQAYEQMAWDCCVAAGQVC